MRIRRAGSVGERGGEQRWSRLGALESVRQQKPARHHHGVQQVDQGAGNDPVSGGLRMAVGLSSRRFRTALSLLGIRGASGDLGRCGRQERPVDGLARDF